MKRLSILIPCHNEEKGIVKTIEEIPVKKLKKSGYQTEIIVIDNNSTDKTATIVKVMSDKVRLIREKKIGKGNALRTGFKAVSENSDFVVIIDGDDTYKPREILRLIEPIESGFCDAVAGSRIGGKTVRGSLSTSHRFVNWAFAFFVRQFYQANITDALTGFIAIRGDVVRQLIPNLTSENFTIEMEMITKMKKLGFSIYSVPITYDRRLGKSKLHSYRDGFSILIMFLGNLRWTPIKPHSDYSFSQRLRSFLTF